MKGWVDEFPLNLNLGKDFVTKIQNLDAIEEKMVNLTI